MTEAAGVVVTHEARDRMQRNLLFAAGVGAVVFCGLLATGDGGILAQMTQLAPVYAWGSVAIVIILPASFILLAHVVPLRVLLALAATASIGFVVVELLWVPSMSVSILSHDAAPWLQGVTALAATITAVRWQGRWVWLYAIATGPIVAVNQMLARQDVTLDAVLAGLGGMLFSLILMGVAIAVVEAAGRQDDVAAQARQQAALEAARRTRDSEQIRINAIVHDDVMSVLLTAGRRNTAQGLAEQAQQALASIAAINDGDGGREAYSPEEYGAVLRSVASEVGGEVTFTSHVVGDTAVPSSVVAATSEALAEALRNSARHAAHAGETVYRYVDVSVDDFGVDVRLHDTGRGFSVRNVGPRRLGIRVSIVERMRSIPGGGAVVQSSPGEGTTVLLTWTRS